MCRQIPRHRWFYVRNIPNRIQDGSLDINPRQKRVENVDIFIFLLRNDNVKSTLWVSPSSKSQFKVSGYSSVRPVLTFMYSTEIEITDCLCLLMSNPNLQILTFGSDRVGAEWLFLMARSSRGGPFFSSQIWRHGAFAHVILWSSQHCFSVSWHTGSTCIALNYLLYIRFAHALVKNNTTLDTLAACVQW